MFRNEGIEITFNVKQYCDRNAQPLCCKERLHLMKTDVKTIPLSKWGKLAKLL